MPVLAAASIVVEVYAMEVCGMIDPLRNSHPLQFQQVTYISAPNFA